MEVNATAQWVEDIVQDPTYDATWAIGRFNECLNLVATAFRIPGLQAVAPVTAAAGGHIVVMPKTYLHDLYLVTSVTYPQGLMIAPNIKELTEVYHPEQVGPVAMVSVDGALLNYRPKPEETEILTLYFYRKPTGLSAGDEFPEYIPEILQKALFLNYALMEAYLAIEDGLDGLKINHDKYGGLFSGGLAALAAFFPNAPKARPVLRRGGGFY